MTDRLKNVAVQRLASQLRFRHLQLLSALQERGTLRGAAEAMNLTQPALSKALSQIEEAFGVQLFSRTARGVVPTAQGQVALHGATILLSEMAHLQQEVTRRVPMLVLRIGAPPFVAHGYLPEILCQLASAPKPLQVSLVEERVPALMHALSNGQLDALVSSFPADAPKDSTFELRYEKLFDAPYTVIAPPKHHLAGRRRLAWSVLDREHWILPAHTALVRRLFDGRFLQEGLPPPVPLIESTSPTTNIKLVEKGAGVAIVPAVSASEALKQRRVVKLDVADGLSVPVALIRREGVAPDRLLPLQELLRGLRRFAAAG